MRRIFLGAGLLWACALSAAIAEGEQQREQPQPEKTKQVLLVSECDLVPFNLIKNCGFETGDLSGWTWTGNSTATEVTSKPGVAHSGVYGLRTGPDTDMGYLSQTFATRPFQVFTIIFWLYNFDEPNRFQFLWDGEVIIDQVMPSFLFTRWEANGLLAKGDTAELSFGFFNVPDYFYIDDIVAIATFTPP